MYEPSENLHDLLLCELRASVHARLTGGADPAEVLADLDHRLETLREMQRGAHPKAGSPEASQPRAPTEGNPTASRRSALLPRRSEVGE